MRECCVDTGGTSLEHLMPSETMGEYEKPRVTKKKPNQPIKSPGLFPLSEEGTYGPPPSYVPPLPGYTRRVKKPKVYAAYSGNRPPVVTRQKFTQARLRQGRLSENTTDAESSDGQSHTQQGESDTQNGESEICFRSVRRREWTDQTAPSGVSLSYYSVQTVVEQHRVEIQAGKLAEGVRQALEEVQEEEGEQEDEKNDNCEVIENSIDSENSFDEKNDNDVNNTENEKKNDYNAIMINNIMSRKDSTSTKEI